MSIGKNIAFYRKEQGLTQNELGDKLGVSNQAVSKWEMEINMPDLMLIPKLAQVLGITINMLYGLPADMVETETIDGTPYYLVRNLPWEDDKVIRCVVFEGRRLLSAEDLQRVQTTEEGTLQQVSFEVTGDPKDVYTEHNLTVCGVVRGDIHCADMRVLGGGVMSRNVSCTNAWIEGHFEGLCNCTSLTVYGDYYGRANASQVTTMEDIRAQRKAESQGSADDSSAEDGQA